MSIAGTERRLNPLIPAQLKAVETSDNIWLSASAGTGKTQVLTARVIRLLLEEDVEPENLLCITFTKAGAAEMAERINQLLASWVQMPDAELDDDLEAIGASVGPAVQQAARQLFAKVLDAPGGGLQIMTIHSFCQSLLGSFPEEAGLIPGFKPVEGREQLELLRKALAEMILAAEVRKDNKLISDLQSLSLAMGEDAALRFLHKCAAVPDVMADIPDGTGAVVWARRVADVGFEGSIEAMLETRLANNAIDLAAITELMDMNVAWQSNRGTARANVIRDWLALEPKERSARFNMLHACWTNTKGEPMASSKGYTPPDPAYAGIAQYLHAWSKTLTDEVCRARYAERLAPALLVGKAFAYHYAQTKHVLGVVDFDDMIRKTADLLNTSNMADWVRYKLDRQIEHILVDEAQDTNKAQWDIIRALSDDFYSGFGLRPEKIRTIFSVGDFKQAIYGFQGTAPERYRAAGKEFAQKIKNSGVELQQLTLSQSFRSTEPVLDFVNALIATSGANSFGITDFIDAHYGEKARVGQIELLPPVTSASVADEIVTKDNDDEESWITSEKRHLAQKLADHAKALIDEQPWLTTKGRHLLPGDILFLLQSRGDLASLLVAQLHERGVPVAGIDRLRLLQPLVVQDLLAAVRFSLQPDDDLSLACLLVSPLIGWNQEKLLKHGFRARRDISLWQHLRSQEAIAGDIEPMRLMLANADFTTCYQFLEQILSGSIAGRRKFAARLGSEALVPMEEMLNAAILFDQQHCGGLQSFLAWFDRGDIEIKRDGESGSNEVRVMTVHGAKGLQAPVVILADITSDPTRKADRSVELIIDEGRRTPLLPIRKAEESGRLGEIVEQQKTRDLQENKRLLYVAVTRAEERLIMGGALSANRKGVVPVESWYIAIEQAMISLGCEWQADGRWGTLMRLAGHDGIVGQPKPVEKLDAVPCTISQEVPEWLFTVAPDEQRPPRPLVPSRIEDDDYGDAPASFAMRTATERGKLIHSIFERIGDSPVDVALDAAMAMLEKTNRNPDIPNAVLVETVRAVITNPQWRIFFGANARSEVPLAAVVGESVITGRLDRMVVEPQLIRILDFKTGRNVPQDEESVPVPYLRQMAHYVSALEVIFPGRKVEAALLFTHSPSMVALSDAAIARYKPAS